MIPRISLVVAWFALCVTAVGALGAEVVGLAPAKTRVLVIPVRDEIADPVLYILRRGLKEAGADQVNVVVLDMKTPGGSGQTAFDMMEALSKFSGKTVTFVNPEAMSAGAFIAAATEEIWFAPDGLIGAAAAVNSNGEDIPETMRLKLNSYMRAKIRAVSEGKGYRGEVISAMIDKDYELKIGGKVLKQKGELLSLTATEASKTYGKPPQPLLAAGTAKTVDEMLTKKFGVDGYIVQQIEITWSERLAVWLNRMSPLFLGLGMLGIFLEFKLPSHGAFAAAGVVLLAVVFLSSYVAGLSGHEPMLVFAVGLLLLGAEIFLVPGSVVLGLSGLVLMLGSLVWAMADVWPGEPLAVAWNGEVFMRPVTNLGLGLLITVVLAVVLWRYLPSGWFVDRLTVQSTLMTSAQTSGMGPGASAQIASLVGRRGVAVTALRPGGQVEVDGQRFEAKVDVGSIDSGAPIVVRGHMDFGLIVEKMES